MSKNKILVTGGAGYIGSHTIIELLAAGKFEVISVDNYSNSSADAYDRIEKITGKKVSSYEVDLCNMNEVENLFTDHPDITGIIHFAAFKAVGESVAQPYKYYHNNLVSLLNLLNIVAAKNIRNFIFSSSCSVYGNIESLPVTESTPLANTESPYATTKAMGERILRDFYLAHKKLNSVALRYFNPVGAHETGLIGESPINPPSNLVPVITQTAIGLMKEVVVFGDDYDTRDGTCIRDYVHVSDIAEAHVLALQHLQEGKNSENYSIYNLGTGNGVSVLEAISSFEKVNGIKLNYRIGERRSGDVEAIYSDSSLAERALNWKTRHDLDSMMLTAWKWQLQLANEQ